LAGIGFATHLLERGTDIRIIRERFRNAANRSQL
jgi:hypothetical protein